MKREGWMVGEWMIVDRLSRLVAGKGYRSEEMLGVDMSKSDAVPGARHAGLTE